MASKSVKRKLTIRDQAAIKQIASQGFQNLDELCAGAFAGVPKSSVWRRLKVLSELGLLHKATDHKGIALGWSLERGSIRYIKDLVPDVRILAAHAPSYDTNYVHDCLLREIKRSFERSGKVTTWISELEMRQRQAKNKAPQSSAFVPDALIQIPVFGDPTVGILELELSRKKKKRIQEKIERYLLSKNIRFVLYAVGSPNLAKFVLEQVNEVARRSVKVRLSQTRIPVIVVDALELRENVLNTSVKTNARDYTLEQYLQLKTKKEITAVLPSTSDDHAIQSKITSK